MATGPLDSEREGGDGGTTGRAKSHVREVESRAARRVAEYLRALGLSDAVRVEQLSREIADACPPSADGDVNAQLAVASAQARVAQFRSALFGADAEAIDPLWFRAFLSACPELFLGDVETARRRVRKFGDPHAGKPPAHASFADQTFEPARVPRWLRGLLPPLLLTALAGYALLSALAPDGLSLLELLWAGLFVFLFGLSSVGMCTAARGYRRAKAPAGPPEAPEAASGPLPRSVLLMPIYHERADQVFAAVLAMRESLLRTPGGEAFEIFVLSDSRNPESAAEEERAWRRVSSSTDLRVPVFYRRRARNDRHKAGNLAEFFERWGHRYSYAVVLDADSLMRGETMVTMVRRLHASPRTALIQAPLALHRGETLFARAQQLCASVYGPIFNRGLSRWAGPNGNYYGHNAVLRVSAFLECCALPELRGEPPLGGHILSHDFVEAALLCRAGWEVRMADDLSGSYEELPPTLPLFVARDRRWCQGNLQHVRIAFAEGLRPMSRIHMLVGAAAYLAGPAWIAWLVLGVLLALPTRSAFIAPNIAAWLAAATALSLLSPRALGLWCCLRDKERREAHGGALRLSLSALLELLLSTLLAPLMMLHHTGIVASILLGRSTRWGTQQRGAGDGLEASVRSEWVATLLGAASALWLWHALPALLPWLAPVWLCWLLAIPLSALVSSVRAGSLLERARLLQVPSETRPDPLALRADDLRALTLGDDSARFRDLVLDPVLVESHLARLADKAPRKASRVPLTEGLSALRLRALRTGPAALSPTERRALAADPESMRWLHREAWRHWPVESWQLSRDRPQLPPEHQ